MLVELPPNAKLRLSRGIEVSLAADNLVCVRVRRRGWVRTTTVAVCFLLAAGGGFFAATQGSASLVDYAAVEAPEPPVQLRQAPELRRTPAPVPPAAFVMPPAAAAPAGAAAKLENDPFGLGG